MLKSLTNPLPHTLNSRELTDCLTWLQTEGRELTASGLSSIDVFNTSAGIFFKFLMLSAPSRAASSWNSSEEISEKSYKKSRLCNSCHINLKPKKNNFCIDNQARTLGRGGGVARLWNVGPKVKVLPNRKKGKNLHKWRLYDKYAPVRVHFLESRF